MSFPSVRRLTWAATALAGSMTAAGLSAMFQACTDNANSGSGGGAGAGGDSSVPDASCSALAECDDGVACTKDSCSSGTCTHVPGPNLGVTACPKGTHCELTGCAANPVCGNDGDCETALGSDPCNANVRCDSATATCDFSTLDTDGDGHAPVACGGDDCDDSRPSAHPGAIESCDGLDDDCDTVPDNAAVCPNPGEYCQSPKVCACKPENVCEGTCVDTQTDPYNCGACGKTCTFGGCVAGACSCGSGETLCGVQCVDTSSSLANCGACGKSCNGAPCEKGACGAPSTELATFEGKPAGLAVADNDVWLLTSEQRVYRVAKSGAAPVLVATLTAGTNPSLGIAVDKTNAYWVDGPSIMYVSLAGGSPGVLHQKTSSKVGSRWVGANGKSVFWYDEENQGATTIVRSVPVVGGLEVVEASSSMSFESFLVTNDELLRAEGTVGSHYVIGSGAFNYYASDNSGTIRSLALAGTKVWWAALDKIRTLQQNTASDFFHAPGPVHALAASGVTLVWMAGASPDGDQTVIGATSTSGSPTKLIGGAVWPTSDGVLAVDQTHAYWAIPIANSGAPAYKITSSLRRAQF